MMLAVLSDDFTGGAEVAAIAVRHGLTAEVHTTFQSGSSCDVVVVDTHTRSSSRTEALHRLEEELQRLDAGGIDRIFYKKVDSVLRGHVAAEIARLLELTWPERAILAPFNPSYGQAIVAREYRIEGQPLDETRFAHDPEYPATTADVSSLVADEGLAISYRDPGSELPETGLVVSGGALRADLLALTADLDARTLAAGGAEFFDVILERRFGGPSSFSGLLETGVPDSKSLFVVGSLAAQSRRVVEKARERSIPIAVMPPALFDSAVEGGAAAVEWAEGVLESLADHDCVLITASERPEGIVPGLPRELVPRSLAVTTRVVLDTWPGDLHLYVSGGATVSALVREVGWSAMSVRGEIGAGVVTLAVPGPAGRFLTVKPGSYAWPDSVIQAIR